MLPVQFAREPLPCLVCGRPVERGEFFVVAAQAQETLRTGSNYETVPQRPVHVACGSPFPMRKPAG